MGDRVPEHRDLHASSSHEPSLEPTRSVDLGKHSIYTHFPPKLRDLPEDRIHKGPVQKTRWRSRTSDSLDELKSSRSDCGKDFPNFEMLDAKIASALNKIVQNSHFKKKVSLEEQKAQKEDRFLR